MVNFERGSLKNHFPSSKAYGFGSKQNSDIKSPATIDH